MLRIDSVSFILSVSAVVISGCAPEPLPNADDTFASTESSLSPTLVAYTNGALVAPWTDNSWSDLWVIVLDAWVESYCPF